MSNPRETSKAVDLILSTQGIRSQARKIYDAALKGGTHFEVHEDKLDTVAEFVNQVILKAYPQGDIPFHARWGHLLADGGERALRLRGVLAHLTDEQRLRSHLELVLISVLVDAGAGPKWSYSAKQDDKTIVLNRSEGLAIASFELFSSGKLSSHATHSLQVDHQGLMNLCDESFRKIFQVDDERNPLPGWRSRVALLRKLGHLLGPSSEKSPIRLSSLFDDFLDISQPVDAQELLWVVLRRLGPIWPSRLTLDGVPLGDVWHYRPFGSDLNETSAVPFHKLSQWLTYSLLDRFVAEGCSITHLDQLTGLAEYRNGGLFIDQGVLSLRDTSLLEVAHPPSSEFIIEWRALTIVLLDKIAESIRTLRNKDAHALPLVKILEGGTWRAGRIAAKEKRDDGAPPIRIESDGTVF
ncbi:MAG: DUF1688 family protein [Myxococcota bacterium]|nr:DUF1688 family protein [Myxococcota bacterium]